MKANVKNIDSVSQLLLNLVLRATVIKIKYTLSDFYLDLICLSQESHPCGGLAVQKLFQHPGVVCGAIEHD